MSPQQSSLLFQVATPGLSRRNVRAFSRRLESEVVGGRAFGCLITSDSELRRLNRQFRQKDTSTDVLSFPADPLANARGSVKNATANRPTTTYRAATVRERSPRAFLGEIAISFPKARQQAAEYGLGVEQEIGILMLHGVLHLLGMDHETDRGRMARAEAKWRAALGLPCGLIERVRA